VKNKSIFNIQILQAMDFDEQVFEDGSYVFKFIEQNVPNDIRDKFQKELMLKDQTWIPNIDRYYKQSFLLSVLKEAQNYMQ